MTETRGFLELLSSRQGWLLGLGIVTGITGIRIAVWVGIEWFVNGTSHEVWALVAGTAIVFSIQLLGVWVLSGLVLASLKEAPHELLAS